jgi:hypothetical protein
MNRLITEPLGVEVNKSGHIYALFRTNNQIDKSLCNEPTFPLTQVVQHLALLGYESSQL